MKSRRKAREAALQALYQCDTLADWGDECIDLYFRIFHNHTFSGNGDNPGENYPFSRMLIAGVSENLELIDSYISRASTRWSLTRMSRVDRNIIRLAVYEIGFLEDIPVNVSINEAIEIAKRFGTDDSPMFINGVLDNIASIFIEDVDSQADRSAYPKKKAVG
jgi:transcription antitermination protein NusB